MTAWRPLQQNEAAIKGWLTVLSIPSENGTRDYIRASERIQLLVDELDLLRDKLFRAGFSKNVYEPPLRKLEEALSLKLLTAQCVHVKQHLTEDVYTGLAFCSELLPEEEEGIKAEEFTELVGLINQLELLLQENTFPAELSSLIRKHIRLAELAIAQYPIRGADSLKEAVKYAAGDLIFSADAIATASPENANTIRNLWRRMNQIADGAIKVDNLAQLGGRVAKLLEDLKIS